MLTFSTKRKEENGFFLISKTSKNQNPDAETEQTKALTGLPVLLILSVESVHALQQLPLLAAARVIDEVPGEDLFQLADGEVFYRLLVVQIRQRGPDPPLCRRTDLQSTEHALKASSGRYNICFFFFFYSINTMLYCKYGKQKKKCFTSKIFSAGSRFKRDAVGVSSCSYLSRNRHT